MTEDPVKITILMECAAPGGGIIRALQAESIVVERTHNRPRVTELSLEAKLA